jgi:hypothetical protein
MDDHHFSYWSQNWKNKKNPEFACTQYVEIFWFEQILRHMELQQSSKLESIMMMILMQMMISGSYIYY